MNKQIHLLKNNENSWDDLQWINEFYEWLQGEKAEFVIEGFKPKLTGKKAFEIIMYLQEVLPVFPDTIERCTSCGTLYDSGREGIHWETKGKFYCSACSDLVPENYDRGKRYKQFNGVEK
jgi:hypothetical protein